VKESEKALSPADGMTWREKWKKNREQIGIKPNG